MQCRHLEYLLRLLIRFGDTIFRFFGIKSGNYWNFDQYKS